MWDLKLRLIQPIDMSTATTVATNTVSGTGPLIPEWAKIAITLFSGGLGAYIIRQFVESLKLRKALKAEMSGMKGLKNCESALRSRGRKPSTEHLSPKDIPPTNSISTEIYESNVDRLGL